MKSINEFATEYAQDKYLPVQTSQAVKAGANYVLEKVERYLNRISVDNHSDDDLEDLYDTLCEMVKNLKGE